MLQQLADLNVAAVAEAAALQIDQASQREWWLLEQLANQTIRSWRVQGFAEGRLALLERHGLVRGDQLYCRIERIADLPGIGRGLQHNLRRQLKAVVRQLEQEPPPCPPEPSARHEPLAQQQLEVLAQRWQALSDDTARLRGQMEARRRELEQQQQQLDAHF
ncbi:hypothetical protein [Cyanobium sp. NIES-981]|uniref:hypothetical protein n=1 Tax=Cyanobium sp. NIES-981 TaxID=1851505 RepID=UPI000B35AF52|nr:hypothetical protein [Cyanobium sp. NIES-981]